MSQRNVTVCSSCGETDKRRLDNGSRGLCHRCYTDQVKSPCEVSGCSSLAVGRLCKKHGYRLRKYGTTEPIFFVRLNYCTVEHCYRLNHAHGLCSYHAAVKKEKGSEHHKRQTTIKCSLCEMQSPVGVTGKIPELCNKCSGRMDHIRRTYGLDVDSYKHLFRYQDHRCAICNRFIELYGTAQNRAVVDHCHETQRVRGLLCGACNTGLGQFRDNPRYLDRALGYLILSKYETPLDPARLRMENATATERKNHV